MAPHRLPRPRQPVQSLCSLQTARLTLLSSGSQFQSMAQPVPALSSSPPTSTTMAISILRARASSVFTYSKTLKWRRFPNPSAKRPNPSTANGRSPAKVRRFHRKTARRPKSNVSHLRGRSESLAASHLVTEESARKVERIVSRDGSPFEEPHDCGVPGMHVKVGIDVCSHC